MTTNRIPRARRGVALVAAALAVAACARSTSPTPTRAVGFQIAARSPTASPSAGAAPLEVTSFRLVAGAATLGNAEQFGCVDCQGGGGPDGQSAVAGTPSRLVTVPLDGAATDLVTEDVSVGTYSAAELSVEAPNSLTTGLDASWPAGATMQINGRYKGTPFTLAFIITGSFREPLSPPVTVASSSVPTTLPVRITLPVASWFVSNGVTLDPSVTANRALIESNARAPFLSTEGTVAER